MTIDEEIEAIFDGKALRPLTEAEKSALANIGLFCVLFSNRSGSTLLCDSLYRRGLPIPPQVEILDPTLIEQVVREHKIPSFTDYFLSTILGWTRSGMVGFKAGASQLLWLEERAYLSCFSSLRLLAMRRRDKVAQAVSLYLAQQSGHWHSGMQPARPPADVPYDARKIQLALDTVSAMDCAIDDFANARGLPLLALEYEDLLARPQNLLSECCEFLDWREAPDPDFQPAVPSLKKQATALNEEYRRRFLAES
jgi:LPS sulfotransferase NodH